MNTKLQRCRFPLNLVSANDTVYGLGRRLLHNGPDIVEEILGWHVAKKEKFLSDEEEELQNRQRLTSPRREALSLYRDMLRATRVFMWLDSQGVLWRDVLRANTRKEFEEAQFETDSEFVIRLIIDGCDAVKSTIDMLVEKQRQ